MPIAAQLAHNWSRKANALVLLKRPEQALAAAEQAIENSGEPDAYFNAALACQALQRWVDAAVYLDDARTKGYAGSDLTPSIATMWLRAALQQELAGNKESALRSYKRSWRELPDLQRNPKAREGIDRLAQ